MKRLRDRPITSGTYFREDLVLKTYTDIFPLPLIQEEQLLVMAKDCAMSTGKFPPGGLNRNILVSITDLGG